MSDIKPKEPIALAFFNRKGGTGKSLTSLSLAYTAAKRCRVLLIDADPQQSATNLLGYNLMVKNIPEVTLKNISEVSHFIRNHEDEPYVIDDLFGEPTDIELILSENAGLHELIDDIVNGRSITKEQIQKQIVTPTFSKETVNKNKKGRLDLDTLATATIKREPYGFDLLPSSEELTDDELYLLSMNNNTAKSTILKQIIAAIKQFNLYDLIIIDCPPSLDLMAINALTGADASIVVCVPDEQSIFSLSKTKKNFRDMKQFDKEQKGILGVVMNMVNKRTLIKDIIGNKITDQLGLYLFKQSIPFSVNASKANSVGLLYPQMDRNVLSLFDSLLDEILQRYEIHSAWESFRNTSVLNTKEKISHEESTYAAIIEKAKESLKKTLSDRGIEMASIPKEKLSQLLQRFIDDELTETIRHQFTKGNLWEPLKSNEGKEDINNRYE